MKRDKYFRQVTTEQISQNLLMNLYGLSRNFRCFSIDKTQKDTNILYKMSVWFIIYIYLFISKGTLLYKFMTNSDETIAIYLAETVYLRGIRAKQGRLRAS